MEYKLNFRNNHGTDQELLDDMKKVAAKLGTKKLTTRAYDDHGIFSSVTIKKRFNGWNVALKKADLEITVTQIISEKELFENLENVWIHLGRQPGKRDLIKPHSKYSETAYTTKFGTWRKALETFVDFINTENNHNQEIVEENIPEPIQANEIIFKHKTKRIPSERLKVQVLMRDGNKCRLCGITLTGDNIHFDHILPWSKGGETTLENLQVLCAPHNLAKGNITADT